MEGGVSRLDRLVVVSPNWLGDAVMALPSLGDLRRRYPSAHIVVAARRAVAGLYAICPLVDEVLALEWSGRLWSARARGRDVAALRAVNADAALLLPNSFASAWLVRRAGIPERWGYAADLRQGLLTRAVPKPAIRCHQARYYRQLVRGLGLVASEGASAEAHVIDAPLVPSDRAVAEARGLLQERGWTGDRPLIVLAPGAAYGGAKRWPAEHFAHAISRLVRERGAWAVLVGAKADAEATSQVRALVPDDARASTADLAGLTTLDTLAGVFALAAACVSNDSGAMHLAAAIGTPLVAMFGPTRERETAPLARPGRPVQLLVNHVWCRPCMLRECPLDHRCMRGLSPERVVGEVVKLVRDQGAGVRE
jgi:heptosyltransferase-2